MILGVDVVVVILKYFRVLHTMMIIHSSVLCIGELHEVVTVFLLQDSTHGMRN
jgi:hypothetical protein